MAFNYARGDFGFFVYQATNGPATTLCVTGHTLDIEVLVYEIINTCSGGLMWRITGRTDAKGTVNADLDLDSLPWQSPQNLKPGGRGVAAFGYSAGNNTSIQVPGIIAKVHYEVAMNTQIKYSFDLQLDARQGQLVYSPVGAVIAGAA